jgi:hypothetical protein
MTTATMSSEVTAYDIIGEPGEQSFKAVRVPASSAPVHLLGKPTGVSVGQYLSYIDRAVADLQASGKTDEPGGLVFDLKRESYFASRKQDKHHSHADLVAHAAVHSAANPAAKPLQSFAYAIGCVEGQTEAWAPALSHLSDDELARGAKTCTGEASYRADLELDRRRNGKPITPAATQPIKEDPAVTETVAAPIASTPRYTHAATPESEWAAMGEADRDAWVSEDVFLRTRKYQSRDADSPVTQPASAPPRTPTTSTSTAAGTPEDEWARMSATDRGRWISRDIFLRVSHRERGTTPDSTASTTTTDTDNPAAAEWAAMSAAERAAWISRDVFIRYRTVEARRRN